ncbi:hypothetical protein M758_9G007200 [Ceratodon purpureus]|nr:hypothetical protein M758_9G007200 [Ceratodon purpureus]
MLCTPTTLSPKCGRRLGFWSERGRKLALPISSFWNVVKLVGGCGTHFPVCCNLLLSGSAITNQARKDS